MPNRSYFSRSFNWLYKALNLESQLQLNDLNAEEGIIPMIDAAQSGWGVGAWDFRAFTSGAQVSNEYPIISNRSGGTLGAYTSGSPFPFSEDHQYLLWFAQGSLNAAGADLAPIYFYVGRGDLNANENTSVISVTSLELPVSGGFNTWESLAPTGSFFKNSRPPLLIPPGCSFWISMPVVTAGQVVNYRFGMLRVPAGFKPI